MPSAPVLPRLSRERALRPLLGAVVVLAAVAAFLPALDAKFVAFDDLQYLHDNPWLRSLSWASLRGMWSAAIGGLWQPLTLLSLAVDYKLWGLEPWGFHATNILLHALTAGLFYTVCLELIARARPGASRERVAWAAAFAALFFAVHPLRAESVAWTVERKDVLSGALLAATVLLRLRGRPVLALAAYAASLASKTVGMTLPVGLLVLEAYPLRRLRRDPRGALLSVAPYAALAAAAAYLSLWSASEALILREFQAQGALWRLAQIAYGLCFYPLKTMWPSGLACYYPPRAWFGTWSWPLFACAAAVAAAAWSARKRAALASALAWYAVTVSPMTGLVQIGLPFSACDRFSYLSCLSFAALFGGALLDAGPRVRLAAAAWLAALGLAASRQTAVWHDTLTLWENASRRQPGGFSRGTYGVALVDSGREAEGLAVLRRAAAAHPELPLVHDNLGTALARAGRLSEAERVWRRGLRERGVGVPELHDHLGLLLASTPGKAREGLAHLRAATAIKPRNALYRLHLADALAAAGRGREAERHYEEAVRLDPPLGRAHNNLGLLRAARGDVRGARESYKAALRTRESRAEANYNWGNLELASAPASAARHYAEALRLEPGFAPAAVNLGNVLARSGRFAEAAGLYRRALKNDPGLQEARVNLRAFERALGL